MSTALNWNQDSRPAFEQFQQRIYSEFVKESAIDSGLFRSAIDFHQDVEVSPGGTVTTPIHDALNWQYTRFGHQAKDFLLAALFVNEDGSCWQAKLSKPRPDQKYESVKGGGSRAYLPAINVETWFKIAKRYKLPEVAPWLRVLAQFNAFQTGNLNGSSIADGVSPADNSETGATPSRSRLQHQTNFKGFAKSSLKNTNPTGSLSWQASAAFSSEELQSFVRSLPKTTRIPEFWDFVEESGLGITIVEGGKKALCLLSEGYVAIALYGVNGGYRVKDGLGHPITPVLIDDIQRFAKPGREIVLAFDQDQKLETRSKVNRALSRFGGLLTQQACSVRVAQWDGAAGKGPDDLIVNCGPEAFDTAYDTALPLEHWQLWNRLDSRLTYKPSLRLQTQDISALAINDLPDEGIFAIASAKGTGKTKFIGGLVAASERGISAGHRICLMRNLCHRLGMSYIGDLDKANGNFIDGSAYTLRVGLCLDSLLAIDPRKFRGCDLVLDETVQVLRHLLTSDTCRKDGKLPALLSRLRELVKVARRVILADADLNNASLDYIRELRGDNAPVYLIRNDYQP